MNDMSNEFTKILMEEVGKRWPQPGQRREKAAIFICTHIMVQMIPEKNHPLISAMDNLIKGIKSHDIKLLKETSKNLLPSMKPLGQEMGEKITYISSAQDFYIMGGINFLLTFYVNKRKIKEGDLLKVVKGMADTFGYYFVDIDDQIEYLNKALSIVDTLNL